MNLRAWGPYRVFDIDARSCQGIIPGWYLIVVASLAVFVLGYNLALVLIVGLVFASSIAQSLRSHRRRK